MKTIKITKTYLDILNIEYALKLVMDFPGIKFQVPVLKNIEILREVLFDVKEKSRFTAEFTETLNRLNEIKVSYANKDENGVPKITSSGTDYEVPEEKLDALKMALKSFWEVDLNKEVLDKENNIVKEYKEYISSTSITVELFTIKLSDILANHFNKEENLEVSNRFAHICSCIIE